MKTMFNLVNCNLLINKLLYVLICCPLLVSGQQNQWQWNKQWSVELLGGFHLDTDYITETGVGQMNNLIPRALGVRGKRKIASYDQFNMSIGAGGRIQLDNAPFLHGIDFPKEIEHLLTYPDEQQYSILWSVEQVTLEIPIIIDYNFKLTDNVTISPNVKLVNVIYFPIENYSSSLFILDGNPPTKIYQILQDYDDYNGGSIAISKPKAEFETGFTVKRELEKYGAINIGVIYRMGTKKLSSSTFVAYEDIPELFTTGRFERNNSFYALTLGFDFIKH